MTDTKTHRQSSQTEALPPFDAKAADKAYKSFPPFSEWGSLPLDLTRWDRYSATLESHEGLSEEKLHAAQEIALRAAAVDTGAIEGLYETDRGFTFTVATQAAAWEKTLGRKGKKVEGLIGSQLDAYDYILDFATQQVPIAEAWIRELHRKICSSQETYTVHTGIGIQEQKLPLGKYKSQPNHVITQDGEVHSHAPVDHTGAEMHRLCKELRSDEFQLAHPVLQASYAHYCFVAVHPFADGNGRVARALASVYSYRAHSVPLLILVEDRTNYLAALASADTGDPGSFVQFVLDRILNAMQLVNECIRTAALPSLDQQASEISRLFVTKGGYSHQQVDEAGYILIETVEEEFASIASKHTVQNQIGITVQVHHANYKALGKGLRRPVKNEGRLLRVLCMTSPPADATLQKDFQLEVPKDCGLEDDIMVSATDGKDVFGARVDEILPSITDSMRLRLRIFADRILRQQFASLKIEAERKLRSGGL